MITSEAEINSLRAITIKLFLQAFEMHQKLGNEGKTPGQFNQFGDISLKADWDAEEVFVNGCKQAGIPIVISSEEHGEVTLGKNLKYRGILDGIDGSNAFKMGTGPYGTMFAIFEGINPRYQDYLVTGILEYPSGRLLLATRNGGSFLTSGDITQPASTSGQLDLRAGQSRIYIDGGIDYSRQFLAPRFKRFEQAYVGNIANKGIPWGASSIYYFKLATGEADLVVECTRKRNLENAVAYGILHEIGAVMVDGNGDDIGSKRYLEFGQDPNQFIPLISAATGQLAQQAVVLLK